jgi:hypothetical protein
MFFFSEDFPFSKVPGVNKDRLNLLFEKANRLEDLNPWEWFPNLEIFRWQGPNSQESDYFTFLGLGEDEGLQGMTVHRGDYGYHHLLRLRSQQSEAEADEILVLQDSLLLAFFPVEELPKDEVEALLKAHPELEGRTRIPLFSSQKPRFIPTTPNADEVEYWIELLSATIQILEELDAGDSEWEPPDGEEELLDQEDVVYELRHMASATGGEGKWRIEDKWMDDLFEDPEGQATVEASRIDRLVKVGLKRAGVWEGDQIYLPKIVEENGLRFFSQVACIVDRDQDRALGVATVSFEANAEQELADALIGSIENQKRLPEKLWVRKPSSFEALFPICQKLGIRLRLGRNLAAMRQLRESMLQDLEDGPTTLFSTSYSLKGKK